MSRVSKQSAAQHWNVPGLTDSYADEVDGYSISMETWFVDWDFAYAYKGLLNDQCQLSHVGYVVKGRFTVRMADGHEEVYEAGDAFVISPGHTPSVSADTEFVAFTAITEESKASDQVVQANMMKYVQEHGIVVSA